MPTMPNLVGLNLQEAEQALESAGVINLSTLGYFGVWPITPKWVAGGKGGIVQAQSPSSGSQAAVNSSIVLTLGQYTVGVSYS